MWRNVLATLGTLQLLAGSAAGCPNLPLHVASDFGAPPSFFEVGTISIPHQRTTAAPSELYRVGDGTGNDRGSLLLLAVAGPGPDQVTLHASPACAPISTFADTGLFLRDLHVATTGSPTGDGSPTNPFDSLARAGAVARAGDRILIHEGSYPGSTFLSNLQGTAVNPIRIGGVDGESAPVLGSTGVGEALHLSDPAYVILEDFTITGATANGVNIDDGGDFMSPAHHVVIRRLTIHDVGTGGNQDCLKLSGLDDFWVLDSTIERCGTGGSGVDMVGCHRGTIAHSTFRNTGANAVQAKGGSSEVVIAGNWMVDAGPRAMNLGGSTGLAFFRPPGANYEARNLVAVANVVQGSDAPTAYVGCDGCIVANNTFYLPQRWVTRILQETTDPGFVQCRDGWFLNNVVVFDSATLSTFVNIGPNTLPATFTFANNLWFSRDDPMFSGPTLPVVETGAIIQLDPGLADPMGGDFHPLPSSPAIGRGLCRAEIVADHEARCYRDPPTVGAYEGP